MGGSVVSKEHAFVGGLWELLHDENQCRSIIESLRITGIVNDMQYSSMGTCLTYRTGHTVRRDGSETMELGRTHLSDGPTLLTDPTSLRL